DRSRSRPPQRQRETLMGTYVKTFGPASTASPVGVDVLQYGTAAQAGSALAAAIAAIDPAADTMIYFPSGEYTWDTVPAIPPGITGSLTLKFFDAKITL